MKPINSIKIPLRYEKMLSEQPKVALSKVIRAKPNYVYSQYNEKDINRINSNVKSILMSNFPTVLFETTTEAIMNKTGERIHTIALWKATPIYIGQESVLEEMLSFKKMNMRDYISRRLKLRRKLHLDFIASE